MKLAVAVLLLVGIATTSAKGNVKREFVGERVLESMCRDLTAELANLTDGESDRSKRDLAADFALKAEMLSGLDKNMLEIYKDKEYRMIFHDIVRFTTNLKATSALALANKPGERDPELVMYRIVTLKTTFQAMFRDIMQKICFGEIRVHLKEMPLDPEVTEAQTREQTAQKPFHLPDNVGPLGLLIAAHSRR